jgi:PAS domain S-box-containing protein
MSEPFKAKILLVDDRPENLLALEAILEPLGHELVRANGGEDALRQLLLDEFAVILLDVQMPGMNGFETAEIIKSRDRTRHTPIIFLTALSKDQEFVYRGYEVGAVDYMSKPLQPEILRSKVAVLVDLWLKNRQVGEQQDQLREAERRELQLQHRAELHESEARIAEIVRCVREAIIMFDDDFVVTTFNSGAEQIFGRPSRDVLGKAVTELLAPDCRSEFVRRVNGMKEIRETTVQWSGTSEQDLLMGVRPGEQFALEASVSRLVTHDSTVYTVIGRDVSERRRAEIALRNRTIELAKAKSELETVNRELNRKTQDLERALSARSRFYASMSHELRTPINAILGYSSLMLDQVYGQLNEKQVRGIERTNRAAKHLLELVNDVLDLSKIEAGKIELQLEPVVFPTLIEDLFVTVRPMADDHGSALTFEHEGAPISIISDPRRVRQILLNLLSNAIKFGRGNPIRVCTRTWSENGIEIEVSDQGVGIAAGDQEKIFDEFVQLALDRPEGTGLGLPISQRLAAILNGSLSVKSKLDVGSTFILRLPRVADSVTEEQATTEAHAENAA